MSDLIDREALENWVRTEMASLDTYEDKEYVIERWRKELPTVAAPRWVRCEEQLPPNNGKEVLVTDGFHVGIGICIYKWSKTKKWTREAVWYEWNLNDYGYPMKKFKTDTHIKSWMPLPEPPKEEE